MPVIVDNKAHKHVVGCLPADDSIAGRIQLTNPTICTPLITDGNQACLIQHDIGCPRQSGLAQRPERKCIGGGVEASNPLVDTINYQAKKYPVVTIKCQVV